MDGANFQEKSTWVMLVGLILTFGVYFCGAAWLVSHGVTQVVAFLPLLVLTVAMLVVIAICGHVLAALIQHPEDEDERDRVIAWRAEHGSAWILGVGAISCVIALALPVERVWIANGLLLALVLSEILRHALQLVYYRRGM